MHETTTDGEARAHAATEDGRSRSAYLLDRHARGDDHGILTAPSAPAATRTLTFLPTADTTVRADQPTATGGSETSLATDNSPVRYSFMRFTVSGWESDIVESAKLRLYVTDGASVGGVFSRVANTTWSESTMNWNTAPPADPTPLATLGAISAATWYEVDLSTLVTGDGQFGLRIATPSSNKISFRSKEGKVGFRPELVVAVAPPTDVATPTASISSPSSGCHGQRIGRRRRGCRRRRRGRLAWTSRSTVRPSGPTTSAPYVIPWDSSSVANGAHELTAVARDAVGNAGASQPVARARRQRGGHEPPTAPTGLVATATGPTRVELSWTASQDDVGVAGYVIVSRRRGDREPAGDHVPRRRRERGHQLSVHGRRGGSDREPVGSLGAGRRDDPSRPPSSASFTFAAAGDFGNDVEGDGEPRHPERLRDGLLPDAG